MWLAMDSGVALFNASLMILYVKIKTNGKLGVGGPDGLFCASFFHVSFLYSLRVK